ncbi:hypothetical protein T484DRAFT_2024031 [Baffinella frigidus]|nr:hypothetical protein T484DRAFT_2024031 [Cryptophyta sp. CCMP2293]
MRPSPSVTLFATALIACASLVTGYSFAPAAALISLRSESGSACAAARPRGLSALSMLAKAKPAKKAAGGGGFGAPKKPAAAPKKEDAEKAGGTEAKPKALGLGARQIGVSNKSEDELWDMVSKALE